MPTVEHTVNRITNLAWLLSVAESKKILSSDPEYKWEKPIAGNFDWLKHRASSVFSSGNSIKDLEILNFVSNINFYQYLKDPWISYKFEEAWYDWILSSTNYRLFGLEQFKYVDYTQGTHESLINFYFKHRNKRFRVFRGEYWWNIENWNQLGINWCYIEDQKIQQNDVCICSVPFAKSGQQHPELNDIIQECDKHGAEILLDFVYLPNSLPGTIDVDLTSNSIKTITFGLGKVFPIQSAKISIRMSKLQQLDFITTTKKENIENRIGSGLGFDLITHFPPDYMVTKYQKLQTEWCNILNLTPSGVVNLATGIDYNSQGRSNNNQWCSNFNDQSNRYNLSILFENQSLLTPLRSNPFLLDNCQAHNKLQ